MEKSNQNPASQKSILEHLEGKARKVFLRAGMPILLSAFLASCAKEVPTRERLSELKERGEVELVSKSINEANKLIESAKKLNLESFESSSETTRTKVFIDPAKKFIEIINVRDIDKHEYQFTTRDVIRFTADGKLDYFNYDVGYKDGKDDWKIKLEADIETGVVLNATDFGKAYILTSKGNNGDISVAKNSHEYMDNVLYRADKIISGTTNTSH